MRAISLSLCSAGDALCWRDSIATYVNIDKRYNTLGKLVRLVESETGHTVRTLRTFVGDRELEDDRPSRLAFLEPVGGLVYATDELLQDANALESYITNNLPEELLFIVENAIVNGTGAGQPLGIMNSGALVTVDAEVGQAAATVVAENVINMWSRRWVPSRNYVWLVHQDVGPQLHQMNLAVGVGGQLVYMPAGGLSQAPYATLMGRPVIESEYMQTLGTTGDIVLCSLDEYQMIEKGGIQTASSIHVRFVYDETCFRFVYRCDGQPKWNAPLTPFHGTNTVSPFVALATRP